MSLARFKSFAGPQFARAFEKRAKETKEDGDQQTQPPEVLISSLKGDKEALEKKLKITLVELRDEMVERDNLEEKNSELQHTVNKLTRLLREKTRECEQEANERDKLDELVSNLERKLVQMKAGDTEPENEITSSQKSQQDRIHERENREKIAKMTDEYENRIRTLDDTIRHQKNQHREKVSKLEEQRDEAIRQVTTLTRQLAKNEPVSATSILLGKEVELLENKLNDMTTANEQISTERNTLEKEIEQLKEKFSNIKDTDTATATITEAEHLELLNRIHEADEEIKELKELNDTLKAENETKESQTIEIRADVLRLTEENLKLNEKKLAADSILAESNDKLSIIPQLEAEIELLETQLQNSAKDKKALELEVEDLQEELDDFESQLMIYKAKYSKVAEEKDQLEDDLELSKNLVDKLKKANNELEEENNIMSDRIISIPNEIEKSQADARSLMRSSSMAFLASQTEIDKLRMDMNTKDERLQKLEKENEMNLLKLTDYKHVCDSLEKLTKVLTTTEEELAQIREKYDESNKLISQLTTENILLKEKYEDMRKENTEVQKLRSQIDDLLTKVAEKDSEIDENKAPVLSMKRSVGPKGRKAPSRYKNKDISNTSKEIEEEESVLALAKVSSSEGRLLKTFDPKAVEGAFRITDVTANVVLKHVNSDHKTATNNLYQIKGRRRPRLSRVQCDISSLNSGDVFVLTMPGSVFVFNGSKSNRLERAKGVDISVRLNRMQNGKEKPVVIDEGEPNEEEFRFWSALGGKSAIKSAEEGGDDTLFEEEVNKRTALYTVDEDETLIKVEADSLRANMLMPEYSYILDCYSELFVYSGRETTAMGKRACVSAAQKYFEAVYSTRPDFFCLTRVSVGAEPCTFTEQFAGWVDQEDAVVGMINKVAKSIAISNSTAAPTLDPNKEAEKMRASTLPSWMQSRDVDNGEGDIDVWKVVGSSKVDIPQRLHGQFYSGHCYVVLYTYGIPSDRSYILYFWQGIDSSKSDQGTSAAIALNMSRAYRGSTQIRVEQNAESHHFKKIFKGKAIVFKGKDSTDVPNERLFHIRGTEPKNTMTAEIDTDSKYFNTNDCSIIIKEKEVTIWKGSHSNEFCFEIAKNVSQTVCPDSTPKVVEEDSTKPTEFFSSSVTTDPQYADESVACVDSYNFFLYTTKTGLLSGEKLFTFSVKDITTDSMYLLDSGKEVFLWIGNKAKEKFKKDALEITKCYVEQMNLGAAKMISEGNEPVGFTTAFQGWRSLKSEVKTEMKTVSDALSEFKTTYPLEMLQKRVDLPKSVALSQLEAYLSDEDFKVAFGITKEQYYALPKWQQIPKKKAAGLF